MEYNLKYLEEIATRIRRELSDGELKGKTLAQFAITFYAKYYDEYDEKNFIKSLKLLIDYTNENFLLCEKREFLAKSIEIKKNILQKMKEIKENIESQKYKLLFENEENIESNNSDEINEENIKFDPESIKKWNKEYKALKENFDLIFEKKPKFFKGRWKDKIFEIYQKLNKLQNEIYHSTFELENFLVKKDEKYRKMFEIIMQDMREVTIKKLPNIGATLAAITYEDTIINKDNLSSFVFNLVLKTYFDFYNVDIA